MKGTLSIESTGVLVTFISMCWCLPMEHSLVHYSLTHIIGGENELCERKGEFMKGFLSFTDTTLLQYLISHNNSVH